MTDRDLSDDVGDHRYYSNSYRSRSRQMEDALTNDDGAEARLPMSHHDGSDTEYDASDDEHRPLLVPPNAIHSINGDSGGELPARHHLQYPQIRNRRRQIPRLPGKSFLPSRRRVPNRLANSNRGVLNTLSDLDQESNVPSPQRVGCYCIAQAFEWPLLIKNVRRVTSDHDIVTEDVLRISLSNWQGDCFIFASYGCLVFWSVEETAEQQFLNFMKDWIDDDDLLQDDEESDHFDWFYLAGRETLYIHDRYFILPHIDGQEDRMLRLALSYAFATSVKLDTLEVAIEATIQATQHIPEELAQKGKIDLSKKEISKYIGELYIQKSAVNLTGDLLDSPDWLWDKQALEGSYSKTRQFLEIDNRCEVLNKRLDVLANLMEILNSFQSDQHSSRLEWIVIWLIVVEVILGVLDILWNVLDHQDMGVF
eukprot:TRINITY_DN5473_c0_g2_i1.p1 TRINITY_DN5473_c0_g2~~TRINITY_DN5473_c0_g2_i1.p1  ORF type:complete len:424 (+),score=91.81 TRINITY_DN5473_c0_g2_i1:66-1337(+)